MKPERLRIWLLVGLVASMGMLLFFPVNPVMNNAILFDDQVQQRISAEMEDGMPFSGSSGEQLSLRILHDDGDRLTNNLSRVQSLMNLKEELLDGTNSSTAWPSKETEIVRIVTPFDAWSKAFSSRNRSLENASIWADVLKPTLEQGWCGDNSTAEEQDAFEATVLMLPKGTNFGVACPSFSGASATQAPEAEEIIWLIWLESSSNDWDPLIEWAAKISEGTEFEISATGIGMLSHKSEQIAKHDLRTILIPSLFILIVILTLGLRDILSSAVTLGGVGLVIGAELGVLSALGYTISVIDMIALPIIMGVAVDGAFWYCKSSRTQEEVRKMLFVAMLTTVAAVSLALISPIRAQRSLAFVMILGIILDWIVTRFILEKVYLRNREKNGTGLQSKIIKHHPIMPWIWPVILALLASVAFFSPATSNLIDIREFIPEDDPIMDEFEILQSKYVIASCSLVWLAVDVTGDSPDDLKRVLDLQQQLGDHSSVVTIETGLTRSPLVFGISSTSEHNESTIDEVVSNGTGSLLLEDPRLRQNGHTEGVAILVLVDSQNSDAALHFSDDVKLLFPINGLVGEVGGDLPVGVSLARAFDASRVFQIFMAGAAVFIVSFAVLRSLPRASRISIGTIAVGAAVDGMASILGERGVGTAPAILLGMGFAADYLSHASIEHTITRRDTSARWWAAITSASTFALLGLAAFPPARGTGRLLTISIIFSVILATSLSFRHRITEQGFGEE